MKHKRAAATPEAGTVLRKAVGLVERAVGEICTGAVLDVRLHGEAIAQAAFGQRVPGGEDVSAQCLFDLASLTKVFVATAALVLFDQRRLSLEDPIAGVLPEFAGSDARRSKLTFRHLLTHTSGLPAHVNFRDELGSQTVIARVCSTPLAAAPGSVVYSDLGFMLLGEALARITRLPLEDAVYRLVCDPIGASQACFRPGASLIGRVVCTEDDSWRQRLLCGEVHDENCWAMGGVAGHAGLFGTSDDVARLAETYRNHGAFQHHRVLARSTSRSAVSEQAANSGERRGLGWALKVGDHRSSGRLLSNESYGHTGYTGTSVWVDPKRSLTVVLLTNRVYYRRDAESIRGLRAAVHDAVVEELEQCES